MALDQSEFCRLVNEHSPALYRLAYRLVGNQHEAEDVVQETFRSVWKSRDRFDPEKGERAWLTTILRRRVVDLYRKKDIKLFSAEEVTFDIGIDGYDPSEMEYSDEMNRALKQLPEELRETLLLVVVGELTHQEASEVLNVPLGTVLSRVSRARKRLREYLSPLQAKSN